MQRRAQAVLSLMTARSMHGVILRRLVPRTLLWSRDINPDVDVNPDLLAGKPWFWYSCEDEAKQKQT